MCSAPVRAQNQGVHGIWGKKPRAAAGSTWEGPPALPLHHVLKDKKVCPSVPQFPHLHNGDVAYPREANAHRGPGTQPGDRRDSYPCASPTSGASQSLGESYLHADSDQALVGARDSVLLTSSLGRSVDHMPRRGARLRDKTLHLGSLCAPLEGSVTCRTESAGAPQPGFSTCPVAPCLPLGYCLGKKHALSTRWVL